jgi:polysaccharide pyruvyl transferase WcaK-like protein
MSEILLVGHNGSANRGCEAIVRCTIDIIRRHVPGARFTLVSLDPASDRQAGVGAMPDVAILAYPTFNWPTFTPGWLMNALAHRGVPGFRTNEAVSKMHLYKAADLVVSVGGDNFTDDYFGPGLYFEELADARAQGAKTAIWGASIGPFHKPSDERKWAEALRQVDLITIREPVSEAYLRKLGVTENVRRVADPAFLLGTEEIPGLDFDAPGGLFGFGMSDIVAKYGSSAEGYVEAFIALGREILAESGTRILLVPHVTAGPEGGIDYPVCRRVAEALDAGERVILLPPGLNAMQMKHAIGRCTVFAGARTHSTIAALSQSVPTLSIAYSSKAYGINDMLLGGRDCLLPIESLELASLRNAFERVRADAETIRQTLQAKLPEVKAMAGAGGEAVASLLQ